MCNVFRKGHRLRLDIQPWDDTPTTRYSRENSTHWRGEDTIHVGGETGSTCWFP